MIMLFSMFETINNKTEHVPHDKAENTQDTETISADLVHILDTIVHTCM